MPKYETAVAELSYRCFVWKEIAAAPASSVGEPELVPQNVVAMDGVNCGLALPALTAHFGGDGGAMSRNRVGEFLGQIKIATDASFVGTINTEHGLGVIEVGRVFDLAVLGDAFGVVVTEIHDQRLQLRIFFRETGRVFGPLAFLLAIFKAGSFS